MRFTKFLNVFFGINTFIAIFFVIQKSAGIITLLWGIPFWIFLCYLVSSVVGGFPLTMPFCLLFYKLFALLLYPIGKLLSRFKLIVLDDIFSLNIDENVVSMLFSNAFLFQLSIIIGSLVQSGSKGIVSCSWGSYWLLILFD